jgi:hypothetical protein
MYYYAISSDRQRDRTAFSKEEAHCRYWRMITGLDSLSVALLKLLQGPLYLGSTVWAADESRSTQRKTGFYSK